MADRVYKSIRVVGCSDQSYERAIEAAVKKASTSVHGISWFTVAELRGGVAPEGGIEWQATVDVAFKVD